MENAFWGIIYLLKMNKEIISCGNTTSERSERVKFDLIMVHWKLIIIASVKKNKEIIACLIEKGPNKLFIYPSEGNINFIWSRVR